MKNRFLKQFWIAFKIWVIALAVNTTVGSLFLTGGLNCELMYFGIQYATGFSFPIFCILLLVIHHCVSRRMSGLQLVRYLLITGLITTVIAFVLFIWELALFVSPALGIVPVLASMTGILSQYGALFRLTDYDKKLEKFLQ